MSICVKCGTLSKEELSNCPFCGYPLDTDDIPTAITPLEKGILLSQRYEIMERIKVGGMGAVYKAKDIRLDKVCAIKELARYNMEEKDRREAIENFKREARILSSLKHPYLPSVTDYFSVVNRYYLTMEFVEGEDLCSILSHRGNPGLPEDEVLDWAIQICDVLSYLHKRTPPVIYRDLKPSNIMIKNSDQDIMLVDFGIARVLEKEDENAPKTTVGTFGYMAPEQYLGKAGPACDIYSLGATLYHLLTGIIPAPFARGVPQDEGVEIREELYNIISTAMEVKEKDRFSSAMDMKKALVDIARGHNALCRQCNEPVEASVLFCKYCGKSVNEDEKSICGQIHDALVVQPEKEVLHSGVEDFVISTDKKVLSEEEVSSLNMPVSIEIKEKRIKKRKTGLRGGLHKLSREKEEEEPFAVKLEPPVKSEDYKSLFKEHIAVELDRQNIKLFQLSIDDSNCIYPAFMALLKTPPKIFKKDRLYNIQAIAGTLKNFLRENQLKVKNISFPISPLHSVKGNFLVPDMNERKLSSFIKNKLQDSLPFSYNEAQIDAYILSRSIPGNEGSMMVKVSAEDKVCINNFYLLASFLGLNTDRVISVHDAFYNSLLLTEKEEINSIAVINFGFYNTGITIMRNNSIVHTNCIKKGLFCLVEAISRAKNISPDRAFEILGSTDIDITWADKKNMDLFQILVPALRDWLTDVTKLFNQFGADYKLNKKNYSHLVLAGDGGQINKLNKFIGNQIGIKCNKFILPVSKSVSSYGYDRILKDSPLFMSSMGLIMSKFLEDEEPGEKIKLKTGFWAGIMGG